jgi:hypothetical protein
VVDTRAGDVEVLCKRGSLPDRFAPLGLHSPGRCVGQW